MNFIHVASFSRFSLAYWYDLVICSQDQTKRETYVDKDLKSKYAVDQTGEMSLLPEKDPLQSCAHYQLMNQSD
ncbi:hypothetical protein HK103_003404, partial [Boothiomyces macroporosus]